MFSIKFSFILIFTTYRYSFWIFLFFFFEPVQNLCCRSSWWVTYFPMVTSQSISLFVFSWSEFKHELEDVWCCFFSISTSRFFLRGLDMMICAKPMLTYRLCSKATMHILTSPLQWGKIPSILNFLCCFIIKNKFNLASLQPTKEAAQQHSPALSKLGKK